jgi:very-short-patch-repair endonuclease
MQRVARFAAAQHGALSRAQALECGVGPRTIDRRLAAGVWDPLYPGVYRLAGSPATWRQSLLAACLAWGDGAVVSHRAAAALWSFPAFGPHTVELSVPRARQRSHRGTVHRPSSLTAVDVTKIDAIPVTTVARTLIDVAACVPPEVVEEALDDVLRRKLVTLGRLRSRLNEIGGPGRRGSGTMAKLIAARADARGVPQSVFETRLLRALRRARLPLPAVQHQIKTRSGLVVLDFAYVDKRVAIEADGFRWHSSRQQWDHDRARANELTMLGWTVVRVTWTQLRDRPDDVIEAIQATLSSSYGRQFGTTE